MAPLSHFIPLGLSALSFTHAQHVVKDSKSACSSVASSFKRENVTVTLSKHIPAFTNLTFSQEGDLKTCAPFSQVVPVDLCRVAMYVSTSPRSGINMEAWLPTNWTGRYLATGNGGLNGCLSYDDMAYAVSFGFATVGANNGHNGTRGTSFANNSEIVTDFAWRSLVTETQVGKEITKAYYESNLKNSYYLGCSTGGRQGFKMAQDFPTLFDGIVAGAPALAFNNLTAWSGRFYPITGTNTSETFVPAEKWALVHEDVLRQCDALDGAKDGILEDPTLCRYKPVTLQCPSTAKDTTDCLTAKQVDTVTAALADYYGENGALIYPRMQPGAELADANIIYSGQPFPYTADFFRYAILNDSSWDPATLDARTAAIAAEVDPAGIQTWKGDLSDFKNAGGKLLHYHGQMDSIITSENSPRYYDYVATTMGLNPSELDSFYRFFRIGGMDHCSRGLGAWGIGQTTVQPFSNSSIHGIPEKYLTPEHNVLLRMVEWVEKGEEAAPEVVKGVRFREDDVGRGVEVERRHCRWPRRNVCVEKGRCTEEGAWRCVE